MNSRKHGSGLAKAETGRQTGYPIGRAGQVLSKRNETKRRRLDSMSVDAMA